MKFVAVIAALLLVLGSPKAQIPTSFATKLETLRANSNLPAVGGVMFDSARIGTVSVTGVRKLGDPTPATAADLWHIGSITKSFTSTLAGRFVERGQLSWSATLGDLIGTDRSKKFAHATLAQVLSHRAGIPPNPTTADIIAFGTSQDPLPVQRRTGIDRALAGDPLSPPGTTFLYSNLDYVLVGTILEEKTGRSWEELVRGEVLEPLKLTTAGFGAPGTRDALTQPRGHRANGNSLTSVEPGPRADNVAFFGPAGTMHMSITDIARWGQEHLRGERGIDGLLRAATYRTIHAPPASAEYAFGWVIQERSGSRVMWHNGSNTMWYAIVAFNPAADRAVVIVTNAGSAQPAINDVAMELLTAK
jgi:CubicO group peptidase (beta-lactamase class C family)